MQLQQQVNEKPFGLQQVRSKLSTTLDRSLATQALQQARPADFIHPELDTTSHVKHDAQPISAAVLVAITSGTAGEAQTVLTKRPETMRKHPGQFAFPGGRVDYENDSTLSATALREAHEEIGLDPSSVEIIGCLPDLYTKVSNFLVTPVVGIVDQLAIEIKSPHEVEKIIVPSLSDLDSGKGKRLVRPHGVPLFVTSYSINDDVIWGATARMLSQLFKRVKDDSA